MPRIAKASRARWRGQRVRRNDHRQHSRVRSEGTRPRHPVANPEEQLKAGAQLGSSGQARSRRRRDCAAEHHQPHAIEAKIGYFVQVAIWNQIQDR